MTGTASKMIAFMSLGLLIIASALQPSVASDPPDSELNPITGFIETVDSVWQVDNHNIRHVINYGNGARSHTKLVALDPANDHGARVAINDDGDSLVVWWRDAEVDMVMLRVRANSSGAWATEKRVSESDESSRNPEIVHDGTTSWIVWEFDDTEGIGISVQTIIDDPNPFGSRVIVSTTDYAGDLDTMIHTEADSLWISWVDSGTEVGWSQYDYGSGDWDTESYEWYANDSVEAARERIRTSIIGQ